MSNGVLFFPATPFTREDVLDVDVLARHIEQGIEAGAGGVFVACGTGEFHALSRSETRVAVETAVAVAAGRVEVFAGVGGSRDQAREFNEIAATAGADGILVLPPYLVESPPLGLVRYVAEVLDASPLPGIVYQRGNARFDVPSARALAQLDRVIGFKDGTGQIAAVGAILEAMKDATDKPLRFFNGTPTAELRQFEYRDIGIDLYSSAVFAFVPEIATAFHDAYTANDRDRAEQLLESFYRPFAALRDKVEGYAVALVKAGMAIRGIDPGGVRAPLVDVSEAHTVELRTIIDRGLREVEQLDVAVSAG